MSHSDKDIERLNIANAILNLLKHKHQGKENAIINRKLHAWLNNNGFPMLGNRKMRKVKEDYLRGMICSCSKGNYFPTSEAEKKQGESYLNKYAISHFRGARELRNSTHEFEERIQKELF